LTRIRKASFELNTPHGTGKVLAVIQSYTSRVKVGEKKSSKPKNSNAQFSLTGTPKRKGKKYCIQISILPIKVFHISQNQILL
jgi:hypothetical protein